MKDKFIKYVKEYEEWFWMSEKNKKLMHIPELRKIPIITLYDLSFRLEYEYDHVLQLMNDDPSFNKLITNFLSNNFIHFSMTNMFKESLSDYQKHVQTSETIIFQTDVHDLIQPENKLTKLTTINHDEASDVDNSLFIIDKFE